MTFNRVQLQEVKKMYKQLSNQELHRHLVVNFGYKLASTSMRTEMYKRGLKKCEILRWTEEEASFLLENYKTSGNIEIAKKLSKKGRLFDKKNVEKKMKLMSLKRTKSDISFIRNKAKKNGVYSKANFERWESKKYPEKHIKVQVSNGYPRVMIKINGKFTPYARHRFLEIYDSVPKGYVVFHKDGNPLNIEDDNLSVQKRTGFSGDYRSKYRRNVQKYLSEENFTKTLNEVPKLPVTEKKKEIQKPVERRTIAVRINEKTVINVLPGTDIEKLKQKYNTIRI